MHVFRYCFSFRRREQMGIGDGEAGSAAAQRTKWIDGLRGIASVMVIVTHLTRAFDIDLFIPQSREDGEPRLMQLPFLRIAPQGRIGVTIFAFLTGYVCALKPLKQTRAGDPAAALSTVAKSAFRRTPRLVLPAILATFFAWTLAQFGAFKVAHRCDSEWIRVASPNVEATLRKEIYRFFVTVITTWTNGRNDYDDHQWSLLPLLRGSMTVYTVLSATVYMKPRYRILATAGLYWFFFWAKDETFGMQAVYGMFMADLTQHAPVQRFIAQHRWMEMVLTPILMIGGLYLASFPAACAEWTPWSNRLLEIARWVFPNDADIPRFYSAIGLDLVIMGIHLSTTARDVLTHRLLLFLGRNSFAVYLIHGTLLRTVLIWMLYGISGQPWTAQVPHEGDGDPPPPTYLPMRGASVIAVAFPAWVLLVYTAAHLWTTHVDSACARLSQRLEKHAFETDNGAGTLVSHTRHPALVDPSQKARQ
ncbi:MAG: hypothetical protein M1838_000349 [Thelocarpon superellum]|nr:MAG: hypothetical protein M1838_000349 [Thelocarpon superellum]